MYQVKVRNSGRNKKTERKRCEENHVTPPKMYDKNSMHNKVSKLEKKYGYDYELNGQSKLLKDMKQQFQIKSVKYLGQKQFTKKQTRFDKMNRKKQLNFEMKTNPIITKIRRIDKILKRIQLQNAFISLKGY